MSAAGPPQGAKAPSGGSELHAVSERGGTALIAEDEPLLAQALQAELARAWPELQVLALVGDGASAVTRALELKPQVLFLDIQMPGKTGLDAAAEIAEAWPDESLPALVFVTAFDQYAVQAFEAQALDYVLKPVQPQRLAQTVARLRQRLAQPAPPEQMLSQLRALLQGAQPPTMAPLRLLKASSGNTVQMVPIDEVLYFDAADKYIRVLTAQAEHLIRTPLRELLPQLDAETFWQVHRGCVVRASAIELVQRDEAGRISLKLKNRAERLNVSRLYAHLFKPM